MKEVNLEYSDVKVLLPEIDYFNQKINSGEKFHFLRVNHSFIDAFHHTYQFYENLEKDVLNKKWHKIGGHIVHAWKDKKWGLKFWHGESTKRREYIANLTEMIFEYDSQPPSVEIGLSLGTGLHEYWGIHGELHPVQASRTKFANLLNKHVNKKFLYSGNVKYYTALNQWNSMFDELREMNFNVVFLGPDWFSEFESVFNISNFSFIEIPRVGAINKLEEYIEDVKNIDNNSPNPTILFYMTGHILSGKIVKELIKTDIYSMDVGRSFDILIKERFEGGDMSEVCWTYLPINDVKEHALKMFN